jgi:hypothetical protein
MTPKRFHILSLTFWILFGVPATYFWMDSVAWVAFMSLWSNISSDLAGYRAASAEKKIDEQNKGK